MIGQSPRQSEANSRVVHVSGSPLGEKGLGADDEVAECRRVGHRYRAREPVPLQEALRVHRRQPGRKVDRLTVSLDHNLTVVLEPHGPHRIHPPGAEQDLPHTGSEPLPGVRVHRRADRSDVGRPEDSYFSSGCRAGGHAGNRRSPRQWPGSTRGRLCLSGSQLVGHQLRPSHSGHPPVKGLVGRARARRGVLRRSSQDHPLPCPLNDGQVVKRLVP